jgi:serine kinase of HPr protein (carbohydrate metabolism regulator)
MAEPQPPTPIHASLISHNGAGCLLLGESGSGKSRLAVEATVLGAKIIADDQVVLKTMSGMLMGAPPKELLGIVHMRGVGINRIADVTSQHVIHLAIDLRVEPSIIDGAPHQVTRSFEGISIPFLTLPPHPSTSALYVLATMRAIQDGRLLPPDWRPGA